MKKLDGSLGSGLKGPSPHRPVTGSEESTKPTWKGAVAQWVKSPPGTSASNIGMLVPSPSCSIFDPVPSDPATYLGDLN